MVDPFYEIVLWMDGLINKAYPLKITTDASALLARVT